MIEEGDIVVTKEGKIGKVIEKYTVEELIKANAPLRIKVEDADEADLVIKKAEKAGFVNNGGSPKCYVLEWPTVVQLKPKEKCRDNFGHSYFWQCGTEAPNPDVTFSDYDQWTAWLEYHSADDSDCPDCSEGEVYSEPRPEDEEFRQEMFESYRSGGFNAGDWERFFDQYTHPIDCLLGYINSLEEQLEEVKQEREELKIDVDRLNGACEYWKGLANDMVHQLKEIEGDRDELREDLREALGFIGLVILLGGGD